MSRVKKILLALLIALIAIQFVQPVRNKSSQVSSADFTKVFVVPNKVQTILQNACYDCHSNNTNYLWYSHIQPTAWLMASHIKNGKAKFNFSDFGSNSNRKQVSKLKEIANQIKDDEMPITSYKMMHKNARLSEAEKILIVDWINNKADRISSEN